MAAAGVRIRVPRWRAGFGAARPRGTTGTQGYYKWVNNRVCQRDCNDAHLIDHDFTATRPNQKWLTDITEHPHR